jgi:hypothetical protein
MPGASETGRLLVVGLGQRQIPDGLATAPVPCVSLTALTAEVLRRVSPDLVLCALFAADLAAGDAFALVERLQSLRYRGRILVICPTLPRPDMIEAELRALGPGPLLTLIARG